MESMFYKKMGLPQQTLVEKSMERKHTDSPGKKKVLGAVVSKEGHIDSLLGYERTHHY